VINTGVTLDYVLGVLRERAPASLEVVTLLDRPSRRIADVHARYTGFQIPDEHVVGYGLGYRELFRNLPFICTLKPSVYASDITLPMPLARMPAADAAAPAGAVPAGAVPAGQEEEGGFLAPTDLPVYR